MNQTKAEIITDEQVEIVHAYANFGDQSKRDVVDEGVLKYAFGFDSGGTQLQILHEHGLVRKPNGYKTTLTNKGVKYLRAMFEWQVIDQIMMLRK